MGVKKGSLNENGTPALVIDVLSTECRWLDAESLIDHVLRVDPSRSRNTVAKAIQRLKDAGRIKSRVSPRHERGFELFEYFSDEWAAGGS